MGDRPQNPPPQVPPGFEFLTDILTSFGPQVQDALTGIFGAPQLSDAGGFAGALGGQIGGQGAQPAFAEGLATGFFPDVLGQVEAQLLPALERSFGRGTAAIKETAVGGGTLSSTGTNQGISDFRGGLESNLLRELAGITGNLAQGAQGVRAGLAGQGIAGILPGIQTGLGQSAAVANRPLQALSGLTGGASSVPLFQPTFGPSKGEQVVGGGTQLGSAFLGNPGALSGKGNSTGGGGDTGSPSRGKGTG